MFLLLAKCCPSMAILDSLSLRCLLAALSALLIALLCGGPMIRYLQKMQIGQVIREVGPESHFSKKGTPTMGGVLILFALSVAVLLWSDLSSIYVWVTLCVTLSCGVIGYMDDHYKKVLKHSRGLASRWKYFWQSVVGVIASIVLYYYLKDSMATAIVIPWLKSVHMELGLGLIVFSYLVIVGSSNAVNLTDGLDGLAIVPVMLVAGGLMVFAFISGNMQFSQALTMPYVPGSGELAVFCAAMIGAGLGFLWFNAYPALVFMGDVGALSLGAALGVVAIIVRQELVLAIMGFVFVMEALSVMLQVGSYKLRNKKRIFRMAPLHHHFELGGMPEPRVTVRFWIVTVILVVIGLSSLPLP